MMQEAGAAMLDFITGALQSLLALVILYYVITGGR